MSKRKIRYMKELLPVERKWLIRAVVGIMIADNEMDELELAFLKRISRVVFHDNEGEDILNEIEGMIRRKEQPRLKKLKVDDPEHLIYMLNILVSSIFANEKKLDEEVKSYFLAGLKLGMTYDILTLKLAYQKERFRIKMLQREVDEDVRKLTAQWSKGSKNKK